MSKFRKRPVVVDACQWLGVNVEEMARWASSADLAHKKARGVTLASNADIQLPIDLVSLGGGAFALEIRTLEGVMKADAGDFIICGVQGEFYPCKPDIFAATYEPAE